VPRPLQNYELQKTVTCYETINTHEENFLGEVLIMTLDQFRNLEDAILNNKTQALKAINVGILNKQGFVDQVITLEELARVGNSQTLNMHNYGNFGEVECEFTIWDEDNISSKVAHLRAQTREQRKGNIING
jgi:hypothetical protein